MTTSVEAFGDASLGLNGAAAMTERVYRVLDEEASWEGFLGDFCKVLRSGMGSLHVTNLHQRQWSTSHAWGISPEELLEYHKNWQDPWIARLDNSTFREGEVRASHIICPDDELEPLPVYRHFLEPRGWHYGAGVLIELSEQRHVLLVTLRSKAEGPLSCRELGLFAAIAPHTRRVIRSLASKSAAHHLVNAMTTAFEAVGAGVAVLSRDGHLFFHTRTFGEAVAGTPDLRIDEGVLRFSTARLQRTFESLIAPAQREPRVASMLLRGSKRYPLRLSIAPLKTEGKTAPSVTEPAFVLVAHDPNVAPSLDLSRAQELFGLTPAESKLAALLVAGHSISASAAILRLSPYTVRAQLRSLFSRTGTARQADLLSLLLRSCSGSPAIVD